MSSPDQSPKSPKEKKEVKMDVLARKDVRKTLLGILTSNNLHNITAAAARSQLEEELEENFETADEQRKIRRVIKELFRANSKKFTKYQPKPTKPTKRKASTA